jgi:hypothetical protein
LHSGAEIASGIDTDFFRHRHTLYATIGSEAIIMVVRASGV